MSATNPMIEIRSRVNARDGKPMVEISWGQMKGELTPSEARLHALGILEACDAAESDAFLVRFFMKKIGQSMEKAVHILSDFRDFRAEEGEHVKTYGDVVKELPK